MAYKFKTSAVRSNIMKRIRSDKTSPEISLQKALQKEKIRFKKNYRKLPGVPDVALIGHKIAVFVDGEFWHGYRWKEKRRKLRANRAYWIPKIERNIARDKQNNRKLRKEGWTVIRFWQQQIHKDITKCIKKIKTAMTRSSKQHPYLLDVAD